MPNVSVHQSLPSSVVADTGAFERLEGPRGEVWPSAGWVATAPLNLLDLIMLHRRELPFVLDSSEL